MKQHIVVLITDYDGNVDVDVKPFTLYNKAAAYLHEAYLNAKLNMSSMCIEVTHDRVTNTKEDDENDYYESIDFFVEGENDDYWVSGEIKTVEVE